MGYMLETRGLTKRFGRGDQAQDAVADVSLHIREGEVYGLLGPNGAGKSTTLKMICGMLRPTAGEILFAGHAWRREDLYAIGSLIEEAPLYPNLTARENLRVRTTLLGLPESRVDEVLAAVDLADTGKKRAGRFSMGMRQRLGLALALIARPRLLVLDEPTNGLDPIGIEELRDQIRGFAAAGTTVIVSSHILSEVQQMADTIGIICGGAPRLRGCASARAGPRGALHERLPGGASSARGGGGMTGEKGGLLAGLRAEALKSRHAAPVRLAVLMALPMPLLGAMPYRGVQIFSAWNYWYALFLPVALSLVVACVARADARTRMRGLLGLGFPLGRAWWAKALWCLALCTLSNLVVFGIYLAGSAFSSQGLTAAGTLAMLLCALANTVTAAWMIPAGLFLTARLGMLAGIFCPLAAQLVGGFAWSLVPLPQLFPPSASMVIPTSFIPVLPSGEPLAADMALGGALAADGMLTLAGLAVCALAFAALTAAGAAWFALDWQHLFGRFREGQPRFPELDRRHVAQRRVDPEVVVPVHVVRELGP